MSEPAKNTDKEIYCRHPGDFLSPKIFVTEYDGIAIEVAGNVIVNDVEQWHRLGELAIHKIPKKQCKHENRYPYFRGGDKVVTCADCGENF